MFSYFMVFALPALTAAQPGKQHLSPASTLLDEVIVAQCIELSRDGKRLAIAGHTWKIVDLTTGKYLLNGLDSKLPSVGCLGVALADDNSLLALGGNFSDLFVVDTSTGNSYQHLNGAGHCSFIKNVYFSPDRRYLISTGGDMMMRVWDLEKKKPHAVFRFTAVNRAVMEWRDAHTEKAKLVQNMPSYYTSLGRCALTSDGKAIAIAGNIHSKVPFLDYVSGKVVQTITIKQAEATALAFSSDGKWLVAGGCEQTAMIEIWDIEKNKLINSFGKHENAILHVAISPDKKTILSGGCFDGFRVWDVATGKQKFSYFTKEDPRMPKITPQPDDPKAQADVQTTTASAGCAFLPDGKTFLIAPNWVYRKTEIYFYDTATGKRADYRKRASALPKQTTLQR